MTGPLQGVRVVEFTEIIAGPVSGVLLSDLGAEVIKVEPPWGDPWRYAMAIGPAESRGFISHNRGKRSIAVDLTKPEGREVVHRLVRQADVVTVNHRPDVPAKLGIDYPTLSAINPRLIYCDTTAFGRKGPDSARPGYDLIVQTMSGIVAAEGKTDSGIPQVVTSSPYVDFSTGHSMASSICAALYYRERTGKGQMIETSLLANALTMQSASLTRVESFPTERQAWTEDDLPLLREAGVDSLDVVDLYKNLRVRDAFRLYYRTYRTSDWVIAVGCLSDPLRRRVDDLLELGDRQFGEDDFNHDDPDNAPYYRELMERAEQIFQTKTASEWLSELGAVGVPAAPMRFIETMIDDEQALANDLIVEHDHSVVGKVRSVGPVTHMSETPPEAELPSPALGQHTDEVLAEIGYSAAEIAALREAGAVSGSGAPAARPG